MTAGAGERTDLPRVSVLGPVEVLTGRGVVHPRGLEADLLALLAAHVGRVVTMERIVDALWEADPPASARNRVQAIVSGLRRSLGPDSDLVLTRSPGYLLGPYGSLDVTSFLTRLATARAAAGAGDLTDALGHYRAALATWRGSPYEGARSTVVPGETARLDELRQVTLEEATEIALRLGQHVDLVAELAGLVAAHPLRERLRGQLMLALYRCGRQAEALKVYQQGADLVVELHGLSPGEDLQRLRQAILTDDPTIRPDEAQRIAVTPPSGPPVPAQLPADVPGFSGRDEHLRTLDTLRLAAGAGSTVVITAIAGLGGVGKTALAVHWAHQVRHQFPDGQLYVNLRGFATGPPMGPLEALAGLLPALGTDPGTVPVTTDDAAALYRSLLADRRMLIVLDNARDADQVRPLLPGTAGSLVLVTSRNDLVGLAAREGAHRLHIDVLTATEAVALLTNLIGADRAATEPGAVTELANLCGGLPLALRIAAANLTSDSHQPIGPSIQRLHQHGLDALNLHGDEASGVRAAFTLSYAALPTGDARLFRLLGLVSGLTIDHEAAAALTNQPIDETAAVLHRLAHAHLIQPHDTGRYGMHDLLRRYAADLAAVDEPPAEAASALQRYHDHYVGRVHGIAGRIYPGVLRPSADPDEVGDYPFATDDDALRWLDTELANITAIVAHTAGHGPGPVAWQLTDGMRGYFNVRPHVVEWLAAGEGALRAARLEQDSRGELAAEMSLANAYGRLNRHAVSIAHLERAHALAHDGGWTAAETILRNNRAAIQMYSGDLVAAEREFRRALAQAGTSQDPRARERALSNLGAVAGALGLLAEARHLLTEATAGTSDDRTMRASAECNLAAILVQLGEIPAARRLIEQSLAWQRKLGYRNCEMLMLAVLGEMRIETGDAAGAIQSLQDSLTIARQTGSHRGELIAVAWLARALDEVGDGETAARQLADGLTLAREIGCRFQEAEILFRLGEVTLHLNQPDRAEDHINEVLPLARARQYRLIHGQAHTVLGEVALARADAGLAAEHAHQAVDILRQTGYRVRWADALTLLGRALATNQRGAGALDHWREALAIYTDVESPRAQDARALIASPLTS